MKIQVVKVIENFTDFSNYITSLYQLDLLEYDTLTNVCNIGIMDFGVTSDEVLTAINAYIPKSLVNYAYVSQIFPITRVKTIGDGIFSSIFSWNFSGSLADSTCGIQLRLDKPCAVKVIDVTNAQVLATKEYTSTTPGLIDVLFDKEKISEYSAIYELAIACTNKTQQVTVSLFSFVSIVS